MDEFIKWIRLHAEGKRRSATESEAKRKREERRAEGRKERVTESSSVGDGHVRKQFETVEKEGEGPEVRRNPTHLDPEVG